MPDGKHEPSRKFEEYSTCIEAHTLFEFTPYQSDSLK